MHCLDKNKNVLRTYLTDLALKYEKVNFSLVNCQFTGIYVTQEEGLKFNLIGIFIS
jgi:hypothetical protein